MPERIPLEAPDLMTPGEVTEALQVNPREVTRRADAGDLTFIRTPGSTRRYYRSSVKAFLNGDQRAEVSA